MKMSIKKKKAFTLVELLVVIAILAILASVSVVGYLGFTAKANLSNDQQMIKMMNDNLLLESVEDAPKNAGDAIQDLYKNGFNNEKLEPFSRNFKYGYNLKNNKMYLFDSDSNVVFPEETVDKADIWGLYTNDKYDVITGVSNYVALETVTDVKTLGAGKHNIDLNGYLYAAKSEQGSTSDITVSNGNIIPGTGVTSSEGVITKKEVTDKVESTNTDNIMEVSNYYIITKTQKDTFINNVELEAKKDETINHIKFTNCIFDGGMRYGLPLFKNGAQLVDEVTFEECTFMNSNNSWGLFFGALNVKFHVLNCEFNNCDRGIGYLPSDNGYFYYDLAKNPLVGSEIKGNKFNLNNKKYGCIQIATMYEGEDGKKSPHGHEVGSIDTYCKDTPLITISGNTSVNSGGMILLHSSLVNVDKNNVSVFGLKVMTANQFSKAFVINNNITEQNTPIARLYKGYENNETLISYAKTFTENYK